MNAGGGERSQVEGSNHRWRGAITDRGEQSVERSDPRWNEALLFRWLYGALADMLIRSEAVDQYQKPLYFFSLPFSHFSLHPLNPQP